MTEDTPSKKDFAVHVHMLQGQIVPITVEASGFSVDQETKVLNFFYQGNTVASFHSWLWVQEIQDKVTDHENPAE